jgi:hypothetical protein
MNMQSKCFQNAVFMLNTVEKIAEFRDKRRFWLSIKEEIKRWFTGGIVPFNRNGGLSIQVPEGKTNAGIGRKLNTAGFFRYIEITNSFQGTSCMFSNADSLASR